MFSVLLRNVNCNIRFLELVQRLEQNSVHIVQKNHGVFFCALASGHHCNTSGIVEYRMFSGIDNQRTNSFKFTKRFYNRPALKHVPLSMDFLKRGRHMIMTFSVACPGKNDVFHFHAQCCRSYTTLIDAGTDSKEHNFTELAKKVIEMAKQKDVMAGSVPLKNVISLLKTLIGQKFPIDRMMQILAQKVRLLQEYSEVCSLTQLMLSHGLQHNLVMNILEILPLHQKDITINSLEKLINLSLEHLRHLGFDEKNLHSLLMSDPGVLFIDSKTRNSMMARLRKPFTIEESLVVVRKTPNVLSDPWSETNDKFEYTHLTMGYKQQDVLKTMLFAHDLQHIQDRHLFLVRAGFFYPVKEKDDPRLNPNPPLSEVVDSSDREFAKKFGGMSEREFQVFLRMREIEREEEEDEVSEDEEEEEEHHKAKKKQLKKK